MNNRNPIMLHLQAAATAIQFLTRIPVTLSLPFTNNVLSRSIVYFPLAGLLIGVILSAVTWLLMFVLPAWPAAVLVLTVWIGLSGGLHLDGWMDTADGVLSHRSQAEMLRIMKDSRVGAMGVIAAILLILLKVSLLAVLLEDYENTSPYLLSMFLCILTFSRAWMSVAIVIWKSARGDEGIGQMFKGATSIYAGAAMLGASTISFMSLIINGLNVIHSLLLVSAVLLLTGMVGYIMASWMNKKLDGLTGDTYGAMNEGVEVSLLLLVVVVIPTF